MTNIIEVHYDTLDQIAARFQGQAEGSAALDRRLRACLEALEQGGWIGLGADAFFGEMRGTVLPAMQRFTAALCEAQAATLQIRDLMRHAEEEAARLFGGDGANTLTQSGDGSAGGPLDLIRGAADLIAKIGDLSLFDDFIGVDDAPDAINTILQSWRALTRLTSRAGGRYPGQFFLKGGNAALRNAIGLATHAAEMKIIKGWSGLYKNLGQGVKLANKQLQGLPTDKLFWLGTAIQVGESLSKNWEAYGDRENAAAQIVAGTAVDAALTVGLGIAGQWGGTVAGTAIGGAIGGPVGALVGAQVGGFVGSLAGSWLGEKIGDSEFVNSHVEQFVDNAAPVVRDAVEQGKQLVSSVANEVQEQVRQVNDGLRAVGETVTNFFKPRLALFGG